MRRLIILTVLSLLLGAVAGVETWAQGAQGNAPRPPRPATPAPKPAAPSDPAKDDKNAPVVVDADSLDSFQKQGLAIFKGNVIARQNNSVQYADKMEVYTDSKTDRVERVVSTGNIRIITRDCRMGTAERAEYYDAEQRVVLIGNARVWRDDNVVTGERITIFLAEDRSVVEAGKEGGRVRGIFYPKREDASGKAESKAPAKTGACS